MWAGSGVNLDCLRGGGLYRLRKNPWGRHPEEPQAVLSEDFMILRLTTMYENGKPPLSPLGERVAHNGVFISRRGPGEGVPIFMAVKEGSP